jgi:hypothetical protein
MLCMVIEYFNAGAAAEIYLPAMLTVDTPSLNDRMKAQATTKQPAPHSSRANPAAESAPRKKWPN